MLVFTCSEQWWDEIKCFTSVVWVSSTRVQCKEHECASLMPIMVWISLRHTFQLKRLTLPVNSYKYSTTISVHDSRCLWLYTLNIVKLIEIKLAPIWWLVKNLVISMINFLRRELFTLAPIVIPPLVFETVDWQS